MYKYDDEVNISGLEKGKSQEVIQDVVRANHLIKAALDYYLQVKKVDAGVAGATDNLESGLQDLEGAIETHSRGIANRENKQIKIESILQIFRWALTSSIPLGEKYGRTIDYSNDDIELFCDDLKAILTVVNRGR